MRLHFLETIGAIEHKDRVAGLICAGGSTRGVAVHGSGGHAGHHVYDGYEGGGHDTGCKGAGRAQCLLDEGADGTGKEDGGKTSLTAVRTPAGERTWQGMRIWAGASKLPFNALVLGNPSGTGFTIRGMPGLRRRLG